jgi:hypothetical protein
MWLRIEDKWRSDVSLYSAYWPGWAEEGLAALAVEGVGAAGSEDGAEGAGRTVDDPGVVEEGVGVDEDGRGAVCCARELISSRTFVRQQRPRGDDSGRFTPVAKAKAK